MPSHALPSGTEARIRRRARRHEAFRQLRDWRTWGLFGACVAGLSLSEGMVSHLWPKAHGAGYVVTHVVAGGVLSGVIAALLVAVVVILAGAVRDAALSNRTGRPGRTLRSARAWEASQGYRAGRQLGGSGTWCCAASGRLAASERCAD